MAEYRATFAYNVRRFVRVEIEASDDETAAAAALAMAEKVIEADQRAIEAGEGFGLVETWEASFYVDNSDGYEVADRRLHNLD